MLVQDTGYTSCTYVVDDSLVDTSALVIRHTDSVLVVLASWTEASSVIEGCYHSYHNYHIVIIVTIVNIVTI